MYEYQLALVFWSAVVAVGLVVPFGVGLFQKFVDVLTDHFEHMANSRRALASIPSNPRPSSPR